MNIEITKVIDNNNELFNAIIMANQIMQVQLNSIESELQNLIKMNERRAYIV